MEENKLHYLYVPIPEVRYGEILNLIGKYKNYENLSEHEKALFKILFNQLDSVLRELDEDYS